MINPSPSFFGTGQITVTAYDGDAAHDPHGRRDRIRFDFTSGGNSANAIYGTNFDDLNGDGCGRRSRRADQRGLYAVTVTATDGDAQRDVPGTIPGMQSAERLVGLDAHAAHPLAVQSVAVGDPRRMIRTHVHVKSAAKTGLQLPNDVRVLAVL